MNSKQRRKAYRKATAKRPPLQPGQYRVRHIELLDQQGERVYASAEGLLTLHYRHREG